MVLEEMLDVERTIRRAVGDVPGRLRARFDTADVVQESLVQVWLSHYRRNAQPCATTVAGPDHPAGHGSAGHRDRELCAAYLRLVGRGQANKLRRRHLALRRRTLQEAGPEAVSFLHTSEHQPPDLVAREEELASLNRALAGLPETEREVICRRYFDRESLVAIARALDLSVDVVRGRQQRAFQRLRKALLHVVNIA